MYAGMIIDLVANNVMFGQFSIIYTVWGEVVMWLTMSGTRAPDQEKELELQSLSEFLCWECTYTTGHKYYWLSPLFCCLQWQIKFPLDVPSLHVLHLLDDLPQHGDNLVLIHLCFLAREFLNKIPRGDWLASEVPAGWYIGMVEMWKNWKEGFLVSWMKGKSLRPTWCRKENWML